jgi:hypothetical protein
MKVRTNLSQGELGRVIKGLMKAADALAVDEIELENPAEREISHRIEALFDTAVNSLQDEMARILLDKED